MMKLRLLFLSLSLTLLSCSGGGSGGGSEQGTKSVTLNQKTSLNKEINSIKLNIKNTSHAFSKAELDQLLADGILSQDDYAELIQLAQL